MRRALIVAFAAALVIVPTAGAWTWPVKGPVLQKFVLGDDPYAAGQHRGIDIGAGAGEPVLAPASGLVSFAGTVPVSGKVVTIQTADGYSVTLTHLGSTGVRRGETVGEDAIVGTIGPTGEVEHGVQSVQLGIRRSEDPNGYIDPLLFLPAPTAPPAAPTPAPPVAPTPSAAPPRAPAAPTAAAPATASPQAPSAPASAPPIAVTRVRTSDGRDASRGAHHGAGSVRQARRAPATAARVSPTRRLAAATDQVARPMRGSVMTSPSKHGRPASTEESRRPTSAPRPSLPAPGRARGSKGSTAGTRAGKRPLRVAVWLWPAALLAGGAAIAAIRRRRRASGSPETAPIIASNVALLPDNPDLLRELDPAHRARVHDDRRRHHRAASPSARRRDVLPDRHGRKRLEERACGRGGRRRPEDVRRRARRGPLATAARPGRRLSRLLHTHDR